MDFKRISEEEKKLLAEVAKSKGCTLEELLIELGHSLSSPEDQKVEFKGVESEVVFSTPAAPEPEVTTAEAKPVVTEPAIPRFEDNIQPEFEPPLVEETVETEKVEAETAPATFNRVCVQCGWDQSQPPIPEPSHQDKIAFLHAVLGQKVFSKRYSVFGGNLRITFRTLTTREIDALYQETFRAQKAGMISTAADYYEYLNRLRIYLQLTAMSSAKTALQIKLPEALSVETQPDAISYWENYLRDAGVYKEPDPEKKDNPTLLMQIQDYILTNVLKTEHLQRAVTHTCNKFNQMVVKLEACVDNPDFWNETEPQS